MNLVEIACVLVDLRLLMLLINSGLLSRLAQPSCRVHSASECIKWQGLLQYTLAYPLSATNRQEDIKQNVLIPVLSIGMSSLQNIATVKVRWSWPFLNWIFTMQSIQVVLLGLRTSVDLTQKIDLLSRTWFVGEITEWLKKPRNLAHHTVTKTWKIRRGGISGLDL